MNIRNKCILWLVLFLIVNGCAGSNYLRPSEKSLEGVNNLAIVVTGKPGFKVLDHRATELGIGALFGIAGALANSAYTNLMDSRQAGKLKDRTNQIAYRENFIDQLKKDLDESGRFQKINFCEKEVVKNQEADAVLKITVKEWGVKLIDQQNGGLVPFIALEIKLMNRKGRVLWKESDVVVGRISRTIKEYSEQDGLLQDAFQTVIEDAAYRISSTLVYS